MTIVSVVTTIYEIAEKAFSLIVNLIISPISIPYVIFSCVIKTIGLDSKSKVTLHFLGVDYVLDFKSQNENK